MEQPTFISPSIINYGPMADTDERRAVVRRLTDALYDYLTLDVVEMERGVKMAAEQANRPQRSHSGSRARRRRVREKYLSQLQKRMEQPEPSAE